MPDRGAMSLFGPTGALGLATLLGGCLPTSPTPPTPRPSKPPAASENSIDVYFSPRGGAMAAILREIDNARRTIDVQAYLMTARGIIDALEAAQRRGVAVRIIIDGRNIGGIFSDAAYLSKSGLPVWRDTRHKDAHDKVMLIDGRTVITGSFNFTDQSEDVNAENLLVIRDKPALFAAYEKNFEFHLGHSKPPANSRRGTK